MFNLPVTRSCGHKEIVKVTDALPPGKSFSAALDKLEKEESTKLCSKCQELAPTQALLPTTKPKSYTGLTVVMYLGILVFFAVLLNIGNIITYAWKIYHGY